MARSARRPSFGLGHIIDTAAGSLNRHLQEQRKRLQELDEPLPEQYAGIVFSGNPHESVPRRLFLDDRLSPLERNVWQVFRLLINADGMTAFPTYEQLRPYLGTNPGRPASRETVAKALTVLRLTRWLSLGKRVRDAINGQMQGNIYILHDEPVGCAEAMEMDKDYLMLIGQSLDHANKTVQEIAALAFDDFTEHGHEPASTRMEVFKERFRHQGLDDDLDELASSNTEFGIRTKEQLSSSELSSESELSVKSRVYPQVRNPNSYSTYTNTNTNTSVCKSSVLREENLPEAVLPTSLSFASLSADQQQRAHAAMSQVSEELREPVLRQWHQRCQGGGIRNPFGYLLTCIQKAIRGEFNTQWSPSINNDPPLRAGMGGIARPVEHQQPQPRPIRPMPPVLTIDPRPKPSADNFETARGYLDQMKGLIDSRRERS